LAFRLQHLALILRLAENPYRGELAALLPLVILGFRNQLATMRA
jgi:hypothetical protein